MHTLKQNLCSILLLPLSTLTKQIGLLQQLERWDTARIPPGILYLWSFLLWILASSGLIWYPEHARLLFFFKFFFLCGCFANEFLVQSTAVVWAAQDCLYKFRPLGNSESSTCDYKGGLFHRGEWFTSTLSVEHGAKRKLSCTLHRIYMSKQLLCMPNWRTDSLESLPGVIKGINWIDRSICPFMLSLNIALLECAGLVMWSYMKDSINGVHVIVIA